MEQNADSQLSAVCFLRRAAVPYSCRQFFCLCNSVGVALRLYFRRENEVRRYKTIHCFLHIKTYVCEHKISSRRASNERPYGFAKQKKYKKTPTLLGGHFICWHLPIFPGRHQPSIFGTTELNFCVRYGNRWTLSVINTNYSFVYKAFQLSYLLVTRAGIEPALPA